jgi:hypothetical protein
VIIGTCSASFRRPAWLAIPEVRRQHPQRRNQPPLRLLLALDYDLCNALGRRFDDGEPQMSRPNILIFMVDQLNGTLFPDGPAEFLHVPNLRALATRSVRFVNSYTASPLCAPARAAFMSGQLPSRTRVYDNAAEFAASVPTFAHHLRRAGYRTVLSGKDAFRRAGPASRLRGTVDDGHLSGGFRLDPRLP